MSSNSKLILKLIGIILITDILVDSAANHNILMIWISVIVGAAISSINEELN